MFYLSSLKLQRGNNLIGLFINTITGCLNGTQVVKFWLKPIIMIDFIHAINDVAIE